MLASLLNEPIDKKTNLTKYLHKNQATLTELALDNCKEDLVHLFSQVELPLLTKFELSEFVAVEDNRSPKKVTKKPKYTDVEYNPMSKIPLHRFPGLTHLNIVNSPNITNRVFEVIVEHCHNLKHLEFGGKPEEYNSHISLEGMRIL